MKTLLILILFLMSAHSMAAGPVDRLNKNGVALCEDRDSKSDGDCYDAVSYLLDNKAVKVGAENSKAFRYHYKNATYVFSSPQHLDLFKADPEKFIPQYGGWCAYAVAKKKEKVDIDPESFYVQKGSDGKDKVLLFFKSRFWGDTRKTWLNDKQKSKEEYFSDAEKNWPQTENKEP